MNLARWAAICAASSILFAQEQKPEARAADPMSPPTFAGLRLRGIGPALTSGRVGAFAVHPTKTSTYYAAVSSGGVWKTVNSGTTWTPVFDRQGSYSIGAVTIDPKNPSVVWVGTGENNNQRSVGYGDGVYRSDDAGRTWKKMGLGKSEHIARILIDPRDSSTVYAAAQGPLWGPGGDRGLYKTTDGGKTWTQVLKVSENTGVTDVVMHPKNPDVLLAAAHQRRRHVWTLVHGGPESAIYKSVDGGKNWTKLSSGIPSGDLGRIGLAVAPTAPDMVYASIEAQDDKSGTYRSLDFGQTWEKRSGYIAQSMYYAHLVVDPQNAERVYAMDVFLKVTDDGGRTFRNLGERHKHVDNHAIWIDPNDNDHYLVGSDGGIYESFDRAQTWNFKSNLPIVQLYDISVDESRPFYNVCGGTQDNNSFCGPSRTKSVHGITNSDWFITNGGDGFHTKVDPKDPNTIYATLQYGVLVRYDKRTGERVGIQPQEGKGEPPLRWNWDSPLMISPHLNTRIYFAANKLFRSDDRGDSWKAVSPDLTRQIDRNQLPVMGKIQSVDAIAKHQSTSIYCNITALGESPKKEGLLYVGTDDGLIQVSENGGGAWRKIETFPGVPEKTYVSRLLASQHDPNTVYAAFDAHKNADFAPYLLKSTDAGKTWVSIQGNLPANGTVLALAEDHVDPKMLFAGTEFGAYFTVDGGEKWIALTGNFPTIAVRDIAIQKRENDLVLGTFGRGIYILDDYTPLRGIGKATLEKDAHLFPPRDALLYLPSRQYGGRAKAFLGESFYTADNPPFGAVITYHLKDGLKSKKELRREAEREAARKNQPIVYPTADQLRAEDEEEAPTILLTVTDEAGKVVRTFTGPSGKGLHRVAWDLREPAVLLGRPGRGGGDDDNPFAEDPGGPFAMPGTYKVSVSKRAGGVVTPLAGPVTFKVVADTTSGLTAADFKAISEFQTKLTRLQRAVSGAVETVGATRTRLDAIKRALDATPSLPVKLHEEARSLDRRLAAIARELQGDRTVASRNEAVPPSISDRAGTIGGQLRGAIAKPTRTNLDQYQIASDLLAEELKKLRALVEVDLKALEKSLDAAGAPPTPGRIPDWK